MTLDQLFASLVTLLTRAGSNRISGPDILTACQNIATYFSTQIASIIPDWTAMLTFQTDGSDAGKYCKYADTNGKKRIFETKVDDNLNHLPPTDPLVTENTYWKEVSASGSAAIPEWAAGVFGPGVVIVYHNHTTEGRGLYILIDPARPYASTNIETEITAGDWERITDKRTFRGTFTPAAPDDYPENTEGTGLAGAIERGNKWLLPTGGTFNGEEYPNNTILEATDNNPGTTFTKYRLY